MIEVTYKNKDNGQEATFSISPGDDDDSANIKINFEPSAKVDMEDPFGILGKLTLFFTGGEE